MLKLIKNHFLHVLKFSAANANDVEDFRIKYLGKKGIISELFEQFKQLNSVTDKKEIGKEINLLKNAVKEKIETLLSKPLSERTKKKEDLTKPGEFYSAGSLHPLTIVKNKILDVFLQFGFVISEGPEIEDDWHNFSALNIPMEHPARDMQDTFFVQKDPDYLLRTHTSSVQVRYMENQSPPIKTISPGRVFRNEAISARAHCIFHQIEGLYIDETVSFADLKQLLYSFAKELFNSKTKVRFRPSYFPFTEPSAEMDISCNICGGKGCNICKHTGWVEILGCGMVDPMVLDNCKINSDKYNGYAFGLGIERIAMLKYQIKDLRLFYENDIRFLNQFKSAF